MDAPTPTRSRDRLSEAKRLLLEKRIRGEAKPMVSKNAIRRVGGGPVFPMSYAQERMWFLDQMEPGNPFYNIPMACLISARVDVPTLERAFTEIVTRHEALRTVYQLVDGEPRQIVQPPHPVPVHVHDMRGPGGEPASEEAIRDRIAQMGARPFDIAHGPVVRVDLIRVSEADCALLINVHHIATDGWSMPIVTREMEQLYEAFAHGRPYPLEPLHIQYADYSLWQREFLTGETLRKQVDYWRGHLQGAPTLELPSDRPRPPVLSYRGTMQRFVWPPALTQRLHAFSVDAGASMNMVIMAGFYLMLHRYSGQDDVVVGTLLGNRNRAELESLVGFLVNSAPVRARVREEMTFRELVAQVRTAVLDADAHQDLPFDKILDAVGAERDPSRSPLFQVMYFHHTFVNNDVHHLKDSEFQSELNLRSLFQETGITLVETHTTKFDLTLATLEHEGVLACMCEYSTDLWDDDTVGRMMEHCRVLLERAAAAPDVPLASIPMLTDAERARLLAWGEGEPMAPVEGTLVERFRAHAARAPRATALAWSGGEMTYGELNARAAALARRLAAAGVRPEATVAVLAEHSPDAVAAMLGVMMAGGAYLPLDPALPPARLAWTLEDAAAAAVVMEPHLAPHLPETPLPVLRIGDSADTVAEAPLAEIDPRSLAYVLYTSGSSGTPKGVGVSHGAAAAHLASAARRYGLSEADRVLAFAAPSFDPSLEQVLAPLTVGASVALRDARLWTPGELADALERLGVTVLNPPTAYWHALVQDAPAAERAKRAVRLVIAGGEAMRADAAERWCALPGDAVLLNVYGPTEAVVTATAARITGGGKPPIGGPFPGRVLRVLDAAMQPAALGVPGELCIGGEALARGYLRRPALTAAAFVPDPFGAPGSRLYRTGDRVRWLAGGELEYLGRTDAQVKVRGFRIEPGEVEAALRAHPSVRDAAAVVREDVPGDRRLVAYVVAVDGAAPDAAELRAFLKARLPEHMVPTVWVAVDAIPLTPGGKVDPRALPAPDGSGTPAGAYEAPRSRVEQVLAELWAGVLRLERVGIHDNFFAIGGDSILSIQIIARAAEQGIRILPLQMFTHQTIAELAAVATSTDAADAEPADAVDESPFALAGLDDDALNDLLSRMG